MEAYLEVHPKKQWFKRLYLKIMLWFTGRAIQAASRVDPVVRAEFEAMPDGYTFCLGAVPNGPCMVVGRDDKGRAKYLGASMEGRDVDLKMMLKSVEHFFLVFTFRESTPTANSRDRLFVDGDVALACSVVRVLDIVQVYLLPNFIAKLAIKRYPKWSLKRHTLYRALVNIRAVIGL